MSKVPPLIINLRNIERHDKPEKNKEHKKHKKHKKHKHKHHHHHSKEQKAKILNPPLLEPVGLPEPEHHLFSYQSSYAPPSPVPYPHVLHPVPTPPSQLKLVNDEVAGADIASADTAGPETAGQDTAGSVTAGADATGADTGGADSVVADTASADTDGTNTAPADTAAADTAAADTAAADTVVTDIAGTDTVGADSAEQSLEGPPILEDNLKPLSFLKLSEDGGVRLNILVPSKQSEESNEKMLNLEQVCGQLQDGLDVIPTDINEEECKEQLQVNPIEHIDPPTFGSYLPIKDSTWANLTKEDSETLLEIYGGRNAMDYAESLQNFAGGTNYLMKMVDSLLDLLTDGKHNKEAVPIRQRLEEVVEPSSVNEFSEVEPDEVQKQLNEIDLLLDDLRKIQEQRLSSSPAPVEPDEAETNLAEEILQKMTKLIKEKAKPSDISDSSSILKALGIPLEV